MPNQLITHEQFKSEWKSALRENYEKVKQLEQAGLLVDTVGPKRRGELNSEYVRRLYLAQFKPQERVA